MKKDSQIRSYLYSYRVGVISGNVCRLLFVGYCLLAIVGTVLAVRSVGVLIVCFVHKSVDVERGNHNMIPRSFCDTFVLWM